MRVGLFAKITLGRENPAGAVSGPQSRARVSEVEAARLEESFKSTIGSAVLSLAKMEWQDFDLDAFLSVIESADLETTCRKVNRFDFEEKPRRDARRMESRAQRRDGAYYRIKCESDVLHCVLEVLGDVPAERVDVEGLKSVLAEVAASSDAKLVERAVKAEWEKENTARPDIFDIAGDIIEAKRPRQAVRSATATAPVLAAPLPDDGNALAGRGEFFILDNSVALSRDARDILADEAEHGGEGDVSCFMWDDEVPALSADDLEEIDDDMEELAARAADNDARITGTRGIKPTDGE